MSLIKCTICTVNVFVIFLPQLFLFLVSKPNKSFSFTQIDQSKSVRKPASSKVPVFNTPKSQIYEPAGAVIASRFKKKATPERTNKSKGSRVEGMELTFVTLADYHVPDSVSALLPAVCFGGGMFHSALPHRNPFPNRTSLAHRSGLTPVATARSLR